MCRHVRLCVLGDASLTPVYLDALTDRSWAAKWYAMAAIHDKADLARSPRLPAPRRTVP